MEKNINFKRSVEELHRNASLWWTNEITDHVEKNSPSNILSSTHSLFVDILSKKHENPWDLFSSIDQSNIYPNIFLKHLTVLADFGGETLQRLNKEFSSIFTKIKNSEEYSFNYFFNSEKYCYVFKELPIQGSLTNKSLNIDGPGLLINSNLNNLTKDVLMLLLFSHYNDENLDLLKSCDLGKFLGNRSGLIEFCQTRYLYK